MAYEQRDMSGSLFKNDRKEKAAHADYRGSALIDGVEHWIDAWINEARDGSKYMSLKFKPKENGSQGASQSPGNAQAFDPELNSDVPFISADPAMEARLG